MPSEEIMKKAILRISLLLMLVSAVYAGVTGSAEDSEPAGKFVPTEKLRADDTVDFPVDI
jgi:hypothetical protein